MIDWDATVAYVLTPSSNGIKIRVAEQEGDPGVRPEEYAGFRRGWSTTCSALTHPDDGSAGDHAGPDPRGGLPGCPVGTRTDLLVTLRDGGFVSILRSAEEVRRRDGLVGTHREHGILLAAGPGVEPGTHPDQSIVDVAPTLLSAIGVSVPDDYEGRALDAFCPAGLSAGRGDPAPAREPVLATATGRDPVYSPEEEADVLGRLESLGYL